MQAEIGNLFEDFKTEFLNTLTMQIDTLQEKKKQVESEKALSIFCSKCRQKHPLRECPLNSVELCGLCEQGHPTSLYPAIPKLKATMQGSEEEVEQAYFVNQWKPWKQRSQGMNSDTASSFNSWNNIYNQGPPQHPMQYSMQNVPQAP